MLKQNVKIPDFAGKYGFPGNNNKSRSIGTSDDLKEK